MPKNPAIERYITKRNTSIMDLRPGDYVRGYVLACPVCNDRFIGKENAKFCSKRCRAKDEHARNYPGKRQFMMYPEGRAATKARLG